MIAARGRVDRWGMPFLDPKNLDLPVTEYLLFPFRSNHCSGSRPLFDMVEWACGRGISYVPAGELGIVT